MADLNKIKVNGVEYDIEDTTARAGNPTAQEKASWNAKADASDIPTALSDLTADATHRTVTDTEKTTWNAKSDFSGAYNDLTGKPTLFSGNYNDLTNKPSIPSKTSDLTNDSGFLVASDITGKENAGNKVTSLSSSSTDTQYPSAKCVYDAIQASGGWTSAQITMLETIFNNLVYVDSSTGQTVATSLINSLRGGTPVPPTPTTDYSISNALTNVSNSNTATSVTQNASYSATLTADDGYEIETVTITMGGTNVTSTVYSGGTITIASVTGNVTIIATARNLMTPVYQIKNQTCDGTQSAFNSENNYLETNKAFTLVADFVPNGTSNSAMSVAKMMNATTPYPGVAISKGSGNENFVVNWMTAPATLTGLGYSGHSAKVIMTHEASTNTATLYYKVDNGQVVSQTLTANYISITQPFVVANTASGTQPFIGTINEVSLYEVVFTSEQINEFFA